MSDSEHSTVTYTSIFSDDGSSDVGSPGVIVLGYDGLPMMLEDPYAYVEAAMQEPPPPDFVPEPVYLEFMPHKDDMLPTEEQPLPTAVSPTTDSPGYITESDLEEDLEEDDEDPDEDPADYSPTNSNTANNKKGTEAGQKSTCFECRAQGHFKRECSKLKNKNLSNQGGNGNAPAKVYVVGNAGTNLDSNIVTENGNSFKPVPRIIANADGTSTSTISGPVTAEEKAQKNDVKARRMLLMALHNEHLLTFSQYKNAKTLFEAIQARFDDIETMSFDDLYNNFKIIEQEVKRTVVSSSSSGSPNMAFLSSPSGTNEVDTASIQVSAASTLVSIVSSPNNTANLKQIHKDDLEEMDLKWKLALLSMRVRRPRNQDSSRKTVIVEDTSSKAMVAIDGEGFEWSYLGDDEVPTNMKLMAFSDSEIHNSKSCSNTCLKSFETLKNQYENLRIELNKSEFDLANYKRGIASIKEQLVFYKKNEVTFCDQIAVLKRNASFREFDIIALNLQLEKLKKEKQSNQIKIDNFENASKSLDKLLGSQIIDNSKTGLGCTSYNAVAPPPTGLFAPPTIDLSSSSLEEFKQPEFESYEPKDSKCVCVDTSNGIKNVSDAQLLKIGFLTMMRMSLKKWNFAPTVVLTKSGIVLSTARQSSSRVAAPVSTARPINTAAPKPIVNVAKSRQNAFLKTHSLTRRPFHKQTTLKNKYLVNNAKVKSVNTIYTNEGKGMTSAVRKQGSNAVKSSACWVWRPKIKFQDHVSKNSRSYICKRFDYVDPEGRLNGCSRHMTGNKSFLSDYQEYDGGIVAFAGSSKGGKITGKGKIRTGKLDFEDVYFVKELKFNLFSVSQMCDKKNSVLFTETECLILSPDFKLPDENQVLLKKGKQHKASCKSNLVNSVSQPLQILHMELFGPIFIKIIMGKMYCLVVTDDYSRPPIITFMITFGCPVTILNTLDHLGKFDGKADEGFLVGYSLNSKAFRVYNSRTKKVEENLHVNFLENKPNVAKVVQNGCLKIHSDVGKEGKQKVSDHEYILLPVLNTSSDVPLSNKEVESSPKDDAGKKEIVEPTYVEGGKIDDLGCLDQQMKSTDDSKNTNNVRNKK
nr:hypothetical protein [Tanacetum cinerariifolium]